jgi:hypothetical protein
VTAAIRHIPVIDTERLRLRAPQLQDFESWAAFFATDRSVWEGGPLPREAAYRHWAADAALWLLRGYGAFGVEDRALAWVRTTFDWAHVMSIIDPGNARWIALDSQALARRIGGVVDPKAPMTGPSDDGHTIVFRHTRKEAAR